MIRWGIIIQIIKFVKSDKHKNRQGDIKVPKIFRNFQKALVYSYY